MLKWPSLILTLFVIAGMGAPASQESGLDATRSKILVEVGKAGAFSFAAGHSHHIEGPVQGTLSVDSEHLESAVAAFEVRTADLRVLEDGEPAGDAPKVQETMASEKVLDVARYPSVTFQSRAIALRQRSGRRLGLTVTGDLTLHGTTRSIVVPVEAVLASDRITAHGTFQVKQTDYGMKPVSVAGGLVSVKNELTIQFTILAPR